MSMPRRFQSPPPRRHQSGAVLYIALIMLVLLALIGVVAMQVATLQERMSANYVTVNMAFQNAESAARLQEVALENQVRGGVLPTLDRPALDCRADYDPGSWSNPNRPLVRRLDLCFAWGDITASTDESNRTDQIFQVTAYRRDRALLPTSQAIVDTVFIP